MKNLNVFKLLEIYTKVLEILLSTLRNFLASYNTYFPANKRCLFSKGKSSFRVANNVLHRGSYFIARNFKHQSHKSRWAALKKISCPLLYKLWEFRKYWHCNSQLASHPSHVTYHTLPSEVAYPTHESMVDIF